MSHEKWNEQKIKRILSNMPKVEDERTKEEMFQRLKEDGVFDEHPEKVVKKRMKWLPVVVTIAALFAAVIIIPSFLNSNNPSEEIATNRVMDSSEESSFVEEKSQSDMFNMTMVSTGFKTSVYAEALEHSIVFSIELENALGEVIPVTMLIEQEKVNQDFGEQQPTNEQLFIHYAYDLDLEALGFIENGLSIKQKQQNSVQQTNYFLAPQPNGMNYLVPHIDQSFTTVEEALIQMKYEVSNRLQSVIIPDVDYSVSESEEIVNITFSNTMDLTQYDPLKTMQMIEGMLLTASSFDKQVQFQNVLQSQWEGFDFTKPLPKPIGANKLPFIVEQ